MFKNNKNITTNNTENAKAFFIFILNSFYFYSRLITLVVSSKTFSMLTSLGTVIVSNMLHPPKAFHPISLTESGMVMFVNELHSPKATSLMVVTESGIVTLVNEVHPLKVPSEIVVIELGMTISFNELQFRKQSLPI